MEEGSFEREIEEAVALAEKILAENNKDESGHAPEIAYRPEKMRGFA